MPDHRLLDIQDNNTIYETCHFIDDLMVSVLLECFEMSEKHTADNPSDHLLRVARSGALQMKLLPVCLTMLPKWQCHVRIL